MDKVNEAIISIKPKYANAILAGDKTVELRRRIPPMEIGTRLWIYATRPTAAIIGTVVLERVISTSPSALWQQCGSLAAISQEDFDLYFEGTTVALGLYLSDVREISPISINQLRDSFGGFHPPQVMARLTMHRSHSLSNLMELS